MKIFRAVLIVLLMLLCLKFSAQAAPVTRLVVWGMESTAESKDQDAEIAAFEHMHPNIRVVTLSMGVGNMNPQKLMTAIVGGVPPDVIEQDRFQIGDWASRGAFQALDGYIANDEKSSNPLAIRQSSFLPATWAETLYKGHVYAIPYGVDDRVLFYNRQEFKESGLDPDRPPQTWSELIYDAKKLTRKTSAGEITRLGFDPAYVQGWLYLWSWQEDGDFMSPDGRRCTIDNPGTAEALDNLTRWYDELGGLDSVNQFAGSFSSVQGAQDPFLDGHLGMKTDSDVFFNAIARFRPDLDFAVCPVPVPDARYNHQGRFAKDSTFVTWSGGFSLVIPRGAAHSKEAWEFIQWMTSPQAALIGTNAQTIYQKSLGRVFVPQFNANIAANRAVFQKYLPTLPPKLRDAVQTALNLLPDTRFRPVTFVGQQLWDQALIATDSATRHNMSSKAALSIAQERVQDDIDAGLNSGSQPLVPVRLVAIVIVGLLLIVATGLIVQYRRWSKDQHDNVRAEARSGLLFITPWAVGFLVFTLGPILASLVLSFCSYDVLHPARWAGFSNYAALVTTDRVTAEKCMVNALYLALFGIPLGMITGLTMALLLNTKIRGLQWYRTIFYIPSVVPTVATAVLWGWILNADPNLGLINAAWLGTISHWFGIAPPGWETVPHWSKPGVILLGLWGAGGGMILWLAGLQSIPTTLYEAAAIDGASAWSRFVNVTLPMLSPYIFFNFIMGVIGALQTFDSSYILGSTDAGGSTGPDDSLLVPVVYLFNNGFRFFKMGYASAIAWVLFVLILGLTLGQLKLAPRWVHYDGDGK